MANLRTVAKEMRYEAESMILWFAVWKNKRSWKAESFYYLYEDPDTNNLYTDDLENYNEAIEKIKEILEEDEKAIIIKGDYYLEINEDTYLTVETLASIIKREYASQEAFLKNAIIEYRG